MILIVDNCDSFTFNLVQRIGEVDRTLAVRVVRNDAVTVDDVEAMSPTRLIISPGPGTPRETGVCAALVSRLRGRIPILGVCLGHQLIADVHGMPVVRHARPMHGKASLIHHDGAGIFRRLPNPFMAARYHSLIVRREDVPAEFIVSAWTDDDEVMGLRWRDSPASAGNCAVPSERAPMDGVQFHPESYLTEIGRDLLANFLSAGSPRSQFAPASVAGITQ